MEKEITVIIEEDEEINATIDLEALKGPQGLSAYEIYLNNLSDGEIALSESEWINSLSKANFYTCYETTYVVQTDNLTVIPININVYSRTCVLEVYVEGFKYKLGVDFTINSDYKSITTNAPLSKNTIVNFVCLKTVVANQNDYNLLKGEKGDDGVGVPSGGTAGQVLVKKSGSNYDTEWRSATDASIKIKRWEGVQ